MDVHGNLLLILAILAHGWTPKIVGSPVALAAIGWALNAIVIVLVVLALAR